MSDAIGEHLKAKAKAAKPAANSRGSGTVARKGTAIARAVARSRKAEETAQAKRDAQPAAKPNATAKSQPRRKRTTAEIHAAKAKGGYIQHGDPR